MERSEVKLKLRQFEAFNYSDYVYNILRELAYRRLLKSTNSSVIECSNYKFLFENFISVTFFILIDLLCLFGNVLVIVAVLSNHHLNVPQNYLLVSLASADLACSIFLMPLHITTYLTHEHWIFGFQICRLFILCDITLCTASIINLCVISLDRYLAMKQPLLHEKRRNKKIVLLTIGIVWFLSCMTACPVFALDLHEIFRTLNESQITECAMSTNRIFVVFSSLLSFYIPASLICYVNFGIYRLTIVRLKIRRKNVTKLADNACRSKRIGSLSKVDGEFDELATNLRRKEKLAKNRERRLTATLFVIVITFIICWSPFFILYVLDAFLVMNLPSLVSHGVLWLGYINSATNPLVYSAMNVDFRKAFINVLRCSLLRKIRH
ncbi:hypothetical protein GJ496_002684 [Pomphorhynchus laevis]|nr:hypothetical protein GJ496_002684 [Pomphorhynchus laevis]